MRRTLGAAIAAAAFLVPAATSQAAVVNFQSGQYCFGDVCLNVSDFSQDGENNNIAVNRNGDDLTITDSGAELTLGLQQGATCTQVNANTVTCPAPAPVPPVNSFTSIQINGRGGNDTLTSNIVGSTAGTGIEKTTASVGNTLDGGAGNDIINGANGNDVTNPTFDSLLAGTGDDQLFGNGGSDDLFGFSNNEATTDGAVPQGGNDLIDGGEGDDFVRSGPGNDTIKGGPGDDFISPDTPDTGFDQNTGNETFHNERGTDNVAGDAGFDEIVYLAPLIEDPQNPGECCGTLDPLGPGVTVTVNDALARAVTTTGNGYAGENDTLSGFEDIFGTPQSDILNGSALSNIITGSGGNDKITGGLGPDTLSGNDGDDDIQAADGEADRVFCGNNAGDKATIDQTDLTSGCPAVGAGTTVTQVANPNIPPADTAGPVITVSVPKKIKASALKKKGIKCGVTSKDTVANRVLCTLTAKVKKVTPATISAAGELILAEKRATFTGKTTITLKLAKKLKKAIKKKKKLRMLVQVTDQAGNTTAKRVNIKVT